MSNTNEKMRDFLLEVLIGNVTHFYRVDLAYTALEQGLIEPNDKAFTGFVISDKGRAWLEQRS